MQFNYIQYLWSTYTEQELYTIVNGGGLESDKAQANKELNRRKEEQNEITSL